MMTHPQNVYQRRSSSVIALTGIVSQLLTHFQESGVDVSGRPVAHLTGEAGVDTWAESEVGDQDASILVENAKEFDETGGEFAPGDFGVSGALQSGR